MLGGLCFDYRSQGARVTITIGGPMAGERGQNMLGGLCCDYRSQVAGRFGREENLEN